MVSSSGDQTPGSFHFCKKRGPRPQQKKLLCPHLPPLSLKGFSCRGGLGSLAGEWGRGMGEQAFIASISYLHQQEQSSTQRSKREKKRNKTPSSPPLASRPGLRGEGPRKSRPLLASLSSSAARVRRTSDEVSDMCVLLFL